MNNESNNGNGKKIPYHTAGIVVVAVGITIGAMLWLTGSLESKAEKSKVEALECRTTVIERFMEKMDTKLDYIVKGMK